MQTGVCKETQHGSLHCQHIVNKIRMSWLEFWVTHLLPLCLVCSEKLTTTPENQVLVEENQADKLLFNGTYVWDDLTCVIKTVADRCSYPDVKIRSSYMTTQGICTFEVTLLTPLDYEKISKLTIDITLHKDCSGIETQKMVTKLVLVTNVMDTPPVFINNTYSVSIHENHIVNTPVVVDIQAKDADGIDSVKYTVNFVDQQHSIFQVQMQSNPEIMDIYLISLLDFEQQHMYHFTITAIDTVGMNSTCDVFVTVINIQDSPPVFTALQYNGRVGEEANVGSSVLTVSAIDGDSVLTQDQWQGTKANEIYYSIQNGDVGMFVINSSTGEIMTVRELDIDSNTNVTNGLVVLTIMAEELDTSMEPQYGVSTATVLVLVQIEDANDNRPQFSSQSFTGNIRVDAVMGELITIESGGYISIYDIDQAPSNNHFTIHIEKDGQPWNVFKPNIEKQYAYASVMIQVNKNNSLMDFVDTHIKFQIVAQEYGDLSQNFAPTKSEMTVWVKELTLPVSQPESIISLPLSASDIIVFIIGLLLLLNVGLTIFVCCALIGGRDHPGSIWSRNSKYYVSNRKKEDPECNDSSSKTVYGEELRKTHALKHEASKHLKTKTNMPAACLQVQAQIDTHVTAVPNEQAINTETPKLLATDTTVSQAKSQAALLNILNENNSHGHDMTPLKTSPQSEKISTIAESVPEQDQLRNAQPHLGQGLSNFLQKVHKQLSHGNKTAMDNTEDTLDLQPQNDKSTSLESRPIKTTHISSNNSNFSEKIKHDGMPLIKSSQVKILRPITI